MNKSSRCFGFDETELLKFFKALCDPNRISIFSRLCGCDAPNTVGEVAQCCEVDLSVVSRHLSQLKDAGLLVSERRGKEILYSVNAKEVVATLRALADTIEGCCCSPTTQKGGKP